MYFPLYLLSIHFVGIFHDLLVSSVLPYSGEEMVVSSARVLRFAAEKYKICIKISTQESSQFS